MTYPLKIIKAMCSSIAMDNSFVATNDSHVATDEHQLQ